MSSGLPSSPASRCSSFSGVTARSRGRVVVDDVSLQVRAGEIVGIAGVEGNGQSELAEVIAGLRGLDAGTIRIAGRDMTRSPVAARRQAGLGFVPDDRLDRGVSSQMSIAENLAAGSYGPRGLSRGGVVRGKAAGAFARSLIARFDVRGARIGMSAGSLSGGNMQKVVLARELAQEPRVLVAAQPTRGLDIGATEFVHQALVAQRAAGRAVLLISSELNEVMALSDRVLVLFRGAVAATFSSAEASEAELGLYMMGVRTQRAAVE